MSGVPGMHKRLSTSPAYAERVRARIRAGGIVNVLEKHILGQREMSASQVSAALGLLRKVVPDLGRTEVTGEGGGPVQVEMTDMEAARLVWFAMEEAKRAMLKMRKEPVT